MGGRSRVILLGMVAIFLRLTSYEAAAVAPVTSHVCQDVCGAGAYCDAECWLTQFEFDNDYPSTTCQDAGFNDCCGNDECNPDTEACNVCPGDCGYTSCPDPPECYANSQCDYGEVCNAARECVQSPPADTGGGSHPPCGGECSKNSDCCGTDVCLGSPGGYRACGVPQTTYCPDSPTCNSSYDCDFSNLCGLFTMTAEPMFCDPGIGRCQFVWYTDCPTEDISSVCN
jgi:hypothetical protein